MALTTSLYTGLSGLNANGHKLAMTGNNIANVNTTGFKKSQATFETLISQTLSSASAPTADFGGSNPGQIGLGTKMTPARDFSDGGLQQTGNSGDMAVEGDGFFIVNAGGMQRYSRAGNFSLDRDSNLVNPDGALVQGWGVDEDYNIQEGELANLNIGVGQKTLAEATRNMRFSGNLNAAGDAASQGALIQAGALFDAGGNEADETTLLEDLRDGEGDPLFAMGELLELDGVKRGGKSLPGRVFEVGPEVTGQADRAGTTFGDLASFFKDALGIDDSDGTAGVTIVDGALQVRGNTGEVNDLDFTTADLVADPGGTPRSPMSFSRLEQADGESVRTTTRAFDSLGNRLEVDLQITLLEKSNAGTQWRFDVYSPDSTDLNGHSGSGVLSFDTGGRLVDVSEEAFEIQREGTGAVTPQEIRLDFSGASEALSALADDRSELNSVSQDGSELGVLTDFQVGEDGVIHGEFSNGLTRVLGQVPLAEFANNEGLEEVGGNLFKNTSSSGEANIIQAGAGGTGRIIGRSLEQSNVDLSEEFINMITATTGFSANSRTLTTSDQLLQELMQIIR